MFLISWQSLGLITNAHISQQRSKENSQICKIRGTKNHQVLADKDDKAIWQCEGRFSSLRAPRTVKKECEKHCPRSMLPTITVILREYQQYVMDIIPNWYFTIFIPVVQKLSHTTLNKSNMCRSHLVLCDLHRPSCSKQKKSIDVRKKLWQAAKIHFTI